MTPQVGQNVQFFEHPNRIPRAAIVTATFGDDQINLTIWTSIPVDSFTSRMGWAEYGLVHRFDPAINRPGWRPIPETVRTDTVRTWEEQTGEPSQFG